LPEKYHYNSFTMVHGSPRYPIWEYILTTNDARNNFHSFNTKYCLVGHTHVPVIFRHLKNEDQVFMEIPQAGIVARLKSHAICNPGSVGQPRDHNPKASYAICDLAMGTWELRRVAYNYQLVQKMIEKAGLPARNAIRLEGGW
ncbi:MAG: metallophosphoesterase family protein, partial [Anaerolineaceae bacterium]